MPLLDVFSHRFDGCVCGARPDEQCGSLLIHHIAFDGRDAYEDGTRLYN